MNKLYHASAPLHPVLQWLCAAVCAAVYWGCCLPSFTLIGQFAVQIALSVVSSALCTAVFFSVFPRSLTFLGKSLSLFLLFALLRALIDQIRIQKETGFSLHWTYTFFYDKPTIVIVVWTVGYSLFMLLRLMLPEHKQFEQFKADYFRFFKDSFIGFLVFYICLLLYSFLLQRAPGAEETPNLIPFTMIRTYIRTASFSYESIFYLLGNILCFFPLGFYFRLFKSKHIIISAIILPILFSLAIEASQYLMHTGHFDVDDILMNCFGFYAGFLLSVLLDSLRKKITKGAEVSIFPIKEHK